jgi:uncharacterized protein YidB (DUF937 family)
VVEPATEGAKANNLVLIRQEDAMGLLDDLLRGALGGATSGQRGSGPWPGQPPAAAGGGGMANVMMALLPVVLSMLASRGGGARQTGGGLGDVLGQVLGGGAQRESGGGIGDVIGGMLGRGAGGAGGLGGLLEQMQRAGLGDQARSWVATGQNMPISPNELGQIFGQGGVEEIARQANLTPQQTSEGLSELLPDVVDHLTPDGQMPDLDQLTLSVENLRRRLGA